MAVRRPAAVRRPGPLRQRRRNHDLRRARQVARGRPQRGGPARRPGGGALGGGDRARRAPPRLRLERRLLSRHHRLSTRRRPGGTRRRRAAGHDHRGPPAAAQRAVPPRRRLPGRLGPRQRFRGAGSLRAVDGPPRVPPGSDGRARHPPASPGGDAGQPGPGRHVAAGRRRAGQLSRDQRHGDDPHGHGARPAARVARRLLPAGGRPRVAGAPRPRPGGRHAGGRLHRHRGRSDSALLSRPPRRQRRGRPGRRHGARCGPWSTTTSCRPTERERNAQDSSP